MPQYPKFIQLKNRDLITLRLMTSADEDVLFEFFQGIPEEDRLVLRHDTTDRSVINRWVHEIDYEKVFPLLAEVRGRIVGNATLHMKKYGWQRHIGEIRIVVATEFRGQGLGKVMIHELIGKATGRGLHHIQISLVDTQTREIKIFERLGFSVIARLPDYVLDVLGREHDLILMTTRVSDIWKKFEELIESTEIDIIRGIQ
jgi:L-amino acid N-acyltransferase YncA